MKLFIFGSTGDLVKRMVIPAFIELNIEYLEIIALGRKDFTNSMYEDFIGKKCFRGLKNKPQYQKIEFNYKAICKKCEELLDKKEINFFYIAMPPKEIKNVLISLGKIKKKNFKIKILIEKPFGENLKAAKNLREILIKRNIFKDVFVSDHYLFKEEVKNLKIKGNFKKMKIVSIEKLGLENRFYYNDVGALRDMIQSHLLNIAFKAMKNPKREFKDFEVIDYIRGQYGDGKDSGYVQELGSLSKTETFAKVKLKTKNKEIEFISGKKFDKKLGFIEIDNKRIYLESTKNPYKNLFLDFFSQSRKNFITVDNSILAWKIIKKIHSKKSKLKYYTLNASAEDAIK